MEDINYIKHLNGAFDRFAKDDRLNPSHISLYMALFRIWNINYFNSDFYINRSEVMEISKIGSTATYHRCIKFLSHWGYILYQPSHNPFKGSRVRMFNFGTSTEQALSNHCGQNETSSEQALNGHSDQNETSSEQALIRINKHIQTITNNKNNNKPENLKNLIPFNFENGTKQSEDVQFRDNLKTGSDKDYGEPL